MRRDVKRITVLAHAKLNLGLQVVAKRDDGFHDIDTVFQTISLADGIAIKERRDATVTLRATGLAVPEDETNLAFRAASLVIERTGCPGVAIELEKRTPVAAGLGGGSADAAAVLVGMETLYGLGLDPGRLRAMALELGSDVPFLIEGGTARGRGRGEILDRLRPIVGVAFVLVVPPIAIRAGEAYASAGIRLTERDRFIRLSCSAIQEGDLPGCLAGLRNDLEEGQVRSHPEIGRIKQTLLDAGALAVVMSGSGPAVFALVRGKEEAREVASRVPECGWAVLVVQPVDVGAQVVEAT